MAENKIVLKSVSELLGMKFFIPSYQRGYRWTEQQVKDLLNDVKEFIDNNKTGFYSLQPLVVKKRWSPNALEDIKAKKSIEEIDEYIKNCEWEVIDGQQRLTTIFIILHYLSNENKFPYRIIYQTRQDFTEFLKKVSQYDDFKKIVNTNKTYDNIDYYHVFSNFQTIKLWFQDMESNDRSKYHERLLQNVKFIWYESVKEDPIKVFTRLNIGKIKLTNSELIKALMLNRSNFDEEVPRHVQLRQQEIASEWDHIEYTLQNDEFWLFIQDKDNKKSQNPTRIDFIFNMICDNENEPLIYIPDKNNEIGTDEYRTFRYFYEYFHHSEESKNELINKCWSSVKKIFQTFQEWFSDLTLYHYVGYLRCPVKDNENVEKLDSLISYWNGDKTEFIEKLKQKIRKRIDGCKDLNKQYELDDCPHKTDCKPLLLLHNIQIVINQNKELVDKKEYGLPIFYKFPFHLYKKEKWDVEHIDSNTTNDLEKEKDQKEWLKYTMLDDNVSTKDELKSKIQSFVNGDSGHLDFGSLLDEINPLLTDQSDWENPEKDKNKIWNFVLLDAGTNRGYGNAIFPAKRRTIIGKDQGKYFFIDNNLKENEETVKGSIAFVPPVTKNVFLKYYNTSVSDMKRWNKNDATLYRNNIYDTLNDFGVIITQNTEDNGDK